MAEGAGCRQRFEWSRSKRALTNSREEPSLRGGTGTTPTNELHLINAISKAPEVRFCCPGLWQQCGGWCSSGFIKIRDLLALLMVTSHEQSSQNMIREPWGWKGPQGLGEEIFAVGSGSGSAQLMQVAQTQNCFRSELSQLRGCPGQAVSLKG